MLQQVRVERAVELGIDAGDEIEIEGGGNALGVIIGSFKHSRRLDAIGANQDGVTLAHALAEALQHLACGLWFEISNCRARKEQDAAALGQG